MASASSSPSNPYAPFQKKDVRTPHARKCVEREGKKEGRQGCQRLGCIGHRGKKTPTLVTGSREAEFTRFRLKKFVSSVIR
jgi:hypothetical protein